MFGRRAAIALAVALAAGASRAPAADGLAAIRARAEAGDAAGALAELRALAWDGSAAAALEHRLLGQLGRHDEALAAAGRWLAAATARGDAAGRRDALAAAGASYAARRLAVEATERYAAALAVAESLPEPRRTAELATALAFQRTHLAEFGEAERLLERAADLARRGGGFGDRFDFEFANSHGALAFQRGDARRALDWRRRAVAAAERLGDAGTHSIALSNLARTLTELHDYAAAIEVQRRALALSDERPDRRAIALGNLGISHHELDQYDEAEAAYLDAAPLAHASGSPGLEGWIEGELGLVAWDARRDADEAVARFARAIELTRRAGDPVNEAVWWTNLGRVRRDQGRCTEGLVAYRRALALRERAGAPHANLIKHIGQCEAALGRDAVAEELFARALADARAKGDAKVIWEAERERARLLRRQRRVDEAEAAYRAAVDTVESMRGSLALPAFKADFFEDKVELFVELAGFLAVERGDAAAAFEVAERARARAFLDALAEARAQVEALLPAAVLDEERRLSDEVGRLSGLLRRRGADEETARALDAAERRLESFRLRIRLEHAAYRELREPRTTTADEVRAALGHDRVLLAFLLGESVSHRWWIGPHGVEHRELPPRAEIERLARAAYAELARPDGFATGAVDAISHTLLGGLAAGTARRWVIVPDGILHFLPFEPLALAGGTELAGAARLAYLPAASLLVAPPADVPSQGTSGRLLALAAARPGAAAAPARRAAGAVAEVSHLPALPFAASEARAVAALWGRRAATLLVGAEATEQRLRSLPLDRFAVLHFAAHGWLDPGSAARSALVLETGEGDDDGLLQVREIVALRLDARLVTLSACRSALGELVTGEGMVGLTRAFLHAGADTVVASLWAVDDEASAALMRHFYRALRAGAPVDAALSRARSALRADARWRHPFYWAPWIVVGAGETPVSFPERGPAALLGLGLVALTAAALGWRARRRRRRVDTAAVPRAGAPCP